MKARVFSKALRYHLEWKSQFRKFLDGTALMAESEIISPEKCRFGKWLSSDDMSHYASSGTLQELLRLHNELHKTAKLIYEANTCSDPDAVRHGLKDMEDISMKLGSLLTTTTVTGDVVAEDAGRSFMTLFNTFLFRKGLFDFYRKMQQDGIEAARSFWPSYLESNKFPRQVLMIYENLINFYFGMNFISQKRYHELLKEQETLQHENTLLMFFFMELQLKIFSESGEKVRDAWKEIVYRQIELNKEVTKKALEHFRQMSPFFYGKEMEKPISASGMRCERRRTFVCPIEFVLSDEEDSVLKGVIMNISDSGLCINSSVPLTKGRRITVRSSLPIHRRTFTVQWSNATITGLSS